jgi:riboflavin-specific deaminase-like protein
VKVVEMKRATRIPVTKKAVREPALRRPVRGPLPFLFINMAMTADGKIATANRAVSTFGSKRDQEHLFELRAGADAVMAGARTVDSGAVTLGSGAAAWRKKRCRAGRAEYPVRVIVSGAGTIRPAAEIFRHRFSPIIILTTERISRSRLRTLESLADAVNICGCDEIDFPAALRWLHQAWGVRRVVCEGGGDLNATLVRAGLVEELHLTVCPWIFGGRSAPTIAEGTDLNRLAEAATFDVKSIDCVGGEAFLVLGRNKRAGSRRVRVPSR